MASPLKGPIARTVGQALRGVMYPVTVSRTTGGHYDPGTGAVVPGTSTDHIARGFVDSFSSYEIANNIVLAGDRRVLILATSLSITPTPATDTVSANGQTLTIVAVKSDPAGAVWEIQAR